MTLVDEDPYGKSERTISAGPRIGKNPGRVGVGLVRPQERPDPHFPVFYFLCIAV